MDMTMTVGFYKWRGISWEAERLSLSRKYSCILFVIPLRPNYVYETNQCGVQKRTRSPYVNVCVATSDKHNLIWTLHRVYWLAVEACAEKPLWKFISWAEGVTTVAILYERVCPTLYSTHPTVPDRSRATAVMVIALLHAPFPTSTPTTSSITASKVMGLKVYRSCRRFGYDF
jgi:hypothetical protein